MSQTSPIGSSRPAIHMTLFLPSIWHDPKYLSWDTLDQAMLIPSPDQSESETLYFMRLLNSDDLVAI